MIAYDRFGTRPASTLPDLSWMDPEKVAADSLAVYERVVGI
jgi:hypothetical protein